MSGHLRGLSISHLALECLETKGSIYYIKREKVSIPHLSSSSWDCLKWDFSTNKLETLRVV